MRLLLVFAISFALSVASQAGSPPTTDRAPAVATQAEVAEATRLATLGGIQLQSGKFDEAFETLTQATEAAGFSALPRSFQLATDTSLIVVLVQRGLDDEAHAAMQSVLARYPAEVAPYHWYMGAYLALQVDEDSDAMAALEHLAGPAGAPEDYWRDSIIIRVLRKTGDDAELADRRYELMKAVWVSGALPPDDYIRPNWLWFELLAEHVERGEYDSARAVMVRLNDPEYVAALSFDRRFSQLMASAPAGGFRLAQAKELSWARQLVADHPRDLRAVSRLVDTLTQQGALDDALAVAVNALKTLQTTEAPPFDDVDEYLHWIHDHRSRILFRLGRHEEALEAQNAALATSEEDGISHQVNLGVLSYLLSKPEAAIAAVETVDGASGFGRMAQQEVRACAYSQLGNAAGLAGAIAYLKENVEDGYTALQSALICADRVDELAPYLVEQLENPSTRREALSGLQRYELKANLTEVEKTLAKRLDDLRQRPDVSETIERYGKVLSWPAMGAAF